MDSAYKSLIELCGSIIEQDPNSELTLRNLYLDIKSLTNTKLDKSFIHKYQKYISPALITQIFQFINNGINAPANWPSVDQFIKDCRIRFTDKLNTLSVRERLQKVFNKNASQYPLTNAQLNAGWKRDEQGIPYFGGKVVQQGNQIRTNTIVPYKSWGMA